LILTAIRLLSSLDRDYKIMRPGSFTHDEVITTSSRSSVLAENGVSHAGGMPLANVTQSLEARPTAQMFQEKRPREAKRAERNWLSAVPAEFLNKSADL
jgi:hypothetical protein